MGQEEFGNLTDFRSLSTGEPAVGEQGRLRRVEVVVSMVWMFWLRLFGLMTGATPHAVVDSQLLQVMPLQGRATADGMTVTLRTSALPVQATWLLRDDDGNPVALAPADFDSDEPSSVLYLQPTPAALESAEGFRLQMAENAWQEFVFEGLQAGHEYFWTLTLRESSTGPRRGNALITEKFEGRFVTVRPPGSSFQFCLFADPHFFVEELIPRFELADAWTPEGYYRLIAEWDWFRVANRNIEREFFTVTQQLAQDRPDFVVGLGDHFDLHPLGFNPAFATPEQAMMAHAVAREKFSKAFLQTGALVQLLGNWEGESGDHPAAARRWAMQARKRYQVNPQVAGEHGEVGPDEDYCAFVWGDVQFVMLNVRGYTTTSHQLGEISDNTGSATDFTLGAAQKAFVERVLRQSQRRYKVVLTHHVVGGNGGDRENSDYGRGGGRAAYVGEQRWLHDLMRECGAQILFYGHDHVFTDLVVDGIHYTLPGTISAPWRFDQEETGYERYWKDSGYGRVDVTPERMRVQFVNQDGEILHQYEVAPHDPSD